MQAGYAGLLRDKTRPSRIPPLGRPVTLVAFANDKPRGDIECGKQRSRTMTHVAVCATFGYARHHR